MASGIIGLAVLGGIMVGLYKLRNFTARTTNQKIFARKGHREGQELVSQLLEFHARATLEEVKNAVLATVTAAPAVPAVIANVHLIRATDDFILYGYGSKLQPHSFRGLLRLEATDDGVRGSWNIINWTQADGIVAGQSVMKRLIADINTALRTVDPEACLGNTPVRTAEPGASLGNAAQAD